MRFSSMVDRVLASWLLGIVLAVVLALAALAVINRTVYSPVGQVRQYFQALSEGDGSRALGILGAEVPEADAAMLDGEAAKNSVADLENLRLETAEIQDGSHALVTATYTVAGEEKSTDFYLSKVGSHWGVFDQWHIDPQQLPTVTVSSPAAEAATLNNVKVGVEGGSHEFAVFYPGVFTATYESALYSSQAQSVVVEAAGQNSTRLAVRLQPSESVTNSVKYQVKSQLDECAAQNSLYPSGCPFEYDFDGRVAGDVTWTITDYPQPEVSLNEEGQWVLPSSSGKARVSFTELDLYTGKTQEIEKEMSFTYTGKLKVSSESVTVSR